MNTTGFPSPAQGYEEKSLDFNAIIVRNPAATFTMRYTGIDLPEANIQYNDLLVIDCSLTPSLASLVIVRTDDGFKCHYLIAQRRIKNKSVFFYLDSQGQEHLCKQVFGVVRAVVRLL